MSDEGEGTPKEEIEFYQPGETIKHPVLGEVREQGVPWHGKRLARYVMFAWVPIEDERAEGALFVELDCVHWFDKGICDPSGKFSIWGILDGRDLLDNGFTEYQIPKEPGLYLMDVTYWTTGGEDADFNHHVNKCSKVELRPTDHPESICQRCGENRDLQCCAETKEDGTRVETGHACGVCHAKGELRASLLVAVLNEAYKAAEDFVEFLTVPMLRDEGPERLERLEKARNTVQEARTK